MARFKINRNPDLIEDFAANVNVRTWIGRKISHRILKFKAPILAEMLQDGYRKEGDLRYSYYDQIYAQPEFDIQAILTVNKKDGSLDLYMAKKMDNIERFLIKGKAKKDSKRG